MYGTTAYLQSRERSEQEQAVYWYAGWMGGLPATGSRCRCRCGDAATVTAALLATAPYHPAARQAPTTAFPPLSHVTNHPATLCGRPRQAGWLDLAMLCRHAAQAAGNTHVSAEMSPLLCDWVSPHPAVNSPSPTRSLRPAGASLTGAMKEGSDSTIRAMS